MTTAPTTEFEFDVALSFAGEDRSYVDGVANALRNAGLKVFYDQFWTTELWGQDLFTYLDDVYRRRSRYAVIFASRYYANGMWTSHERQSAQARALRDKDAFLLPVRLDDTDIPGIRPQIGYLDSRRLTRAELVGHIVAKVSTRGTAPLRTEPFLGVPLTAPDRQRVAAERPWGWEWLLLAGGVWQEAKNLEPNRYDHEMGYAVGTGQHVSRDGLGSFLNRATDELTTATSKLDTVIGRTEWATGPKGEPGDPIRIEHLAHRFGTAYAEILDWSARVRGTAAAREYRDLLERLARLADAPVRQLQRFVDDLVAAGGRIATHYAQPGASPVDDLTISLNLDLAMDPQQFADYQAERARHT